MNYLSLDPKLVEVAVRCLKTVALADGEIHDLEARLMNSALGAMHVDIDFHRVLPITPWDAAAAVTDPVWRTRIVQAQMVMAMIDGEVDRVELDVVAEFAAAMDVDDPRLHNLEQLVGGHMLLLRLDLSRRSKMIEDVGKAAFERAGVRGLWHTFGSMVGLSTDAETAAKWRALADLPHDTLGYHYYRHMADRDFTLPGERKAFPELLAKHDLCHVLGDYDTDPLGECEVICFICGFMQRDPFWYLFMIATQMHLGVKTFQDDTPTDTFQFVPERIVAALKRGADVNRDLYDVEWDFWADLPLPIDEVRRKYNVLPK